MCGVAVPVANFKYPDVEENDVVGRERVSYLRESGGLPSSLPFGVTLLGKEGMDEYVWEIADRFQKETKLT